MKKFDYSIFIGRFQPFHNAHLVLLRKALELAERTIVIIGSHNQAVNTKNPWSSQEREHMIRASLTEAENERVQVIYMRDSLYSDNLWITSLQEKIKSSVSDTDRVVLVGCDYDKSSYYLKLFPQWEMELVRNMDEHPRATEVRNGFFSSEEAWKKFVPVTTAECLSKFKDSDAYPRLKEEFEFLVEYKAKWNAAPFAPTFITTDAIVIKSGHVLVVRRGGKLGNKLIALPGGFLDPHEKIEDGMVRELKEETRIKLPKAHLRSAIKASRVFDHPERSLRGRTITHAYLLDLGSGDLPKVKGSSDADKAWWMPLSEFMTREHEFFEDHWHIISFFILKF
jgi:bifunctional NMN adenylyltransferase/nudix hydrolase